MKTIRLFSKVILVILFTIANNFGQTYYIQRTKSSSGTQGNTIGQTFTTAGSVGIVSINVSCKNMVAVNGLRFHRSTPIYVKSNAVFEFVISAPPLQSFYCKFFQKLSSTTHALQISPS